MWVDVGWGGVVWYVVGLYWDWCSRWCVVVVEVVCIDGL